MIFFKVFLHSEGKGVKYLSGKRVIKPATGVSRFLSLITRKCNFVLFVLGFYSPINNEVMPSRSVNSGSVPGQA